MTHTLQNRVEGRPNVTPTSLSAFDHANTRTSSWSIHQDTVGVDPERSYHGSPGHDPR